MTPEQEKLLTVLAQNTRFMLQRMSEIQDKLDQIEQVMVKWPGMHVSIYDAHRADEKMAEWEKHVAGEHSDDDVSDIVDVDGPLELR